MHRTGKAGIFGLLIFVAQCCRLLVLFGGFGIFLLSEKRIPEVVMCLEGIVVLFQSTTVVHLGFVVLLFVVLTIAVPHIRCLFLGKEQSRHKGQYKA